MAVRKKNPGENNTNPPEITPNKRAEERLKIFQVFMENARDIILFVRISDGRIIEANQKASEVYGYSHDTLLGMTIFDLRASDSRTKIDHQMKEADARGILFEAIHRCKDGRDIPVEVNSFSMKLDGETVICSIIRDFTERKLREDTQTFLVQSGYPGSGENFFDSLARYLAEHLDMDYVCIDTLEGDGLTAQTVSVFNDGKFDTNVHYALKDTPCGVVVGKTICCFTDDVSQLFPNDAALQDLKARSYVGTTLWSSDRKPIGLIALIGRKPLQNPELVKEVIQQVSIRTAGEIERNKAEKALRESEERFRSIIENLQDGFIRADTTGTILMVNPCAVRMFGYGSTGEMIGLSAFILYKDPDVRNILMDEVWKLGNVTDYEIDLVRKDGSFIPVSLNVQFYYDNQDRIQGTEAFIRDISLRKQIEKAMKEEWDFVNGVLSTVGGLIIVLDREGRIVRFNRACEILTGYSFEEVKGKQFWDLFVLPEEIQGVKDTFAELTNGMFPNEHENFWVAKDGTRRFIQWSNSAMTGADGAVTYVLGTGIDITERKKADEALREALAEKEILLSEIHHRVKNNLAAFISLLSLEGSYEDTESGRALRTDLQNRARSMALIHETLYKTRQFAEVDMEVYLSTLADQVVKSFRSAHSVKTIVDTKGVTLDLGRATPTGLIINELMTNSLKYAFPEEVVAKLKNQSELPTVGIRITKEDGNYLMKVFDNGIGLPTGFDLSTTQTLGLKLVNFLARHQLGATPEINTEKGTEFVFRFME